MEKSAIEQLQETGKLPEIIEQVNGTQEPVVIVPNSMGVHSIDKYMKNPARYRLLFETNSVDAFLEYNAANKTDSATCFVEALDMSALTVFDLGSQEAPLHKAHKAKVSLLKTAAYKALLAIIDYGKDQKEASEFLEDWEDQIEVRDSQSGAMNPRLAAKALRLLTIETARAISSEINDFSTSQSAMERIEVKDSNAMPALILFKCKPYSSLHSRSFPVRASVLTSGNSPKIIFRIIKHEEILEDMAEEFKRSLEEKLEDSDIKTYLGSM